MMNKWTPDVSVPPVNLSNCMPSPLTSRTMTLRACTWTYCMHVCLSHASQCGPQTWAQCLTVCLGWSWDNCWLSGVFSLLLPPPHPFSCPRFDYNQVFFLILQWAKEQRTVPRASRWAASCWTVSNTWGSDQPVSASSRCSASHSHACLTFPPWQAHLITLYAAWDWVRSATKQN